MKGWTGGWIQREERELVNKHLRGRYAANWQRDREEHRKRGLKRARDKIQMEKYVHSGWSFKKRENIRMDFLKRINKKEEWKWGV